MDKREANASDSLTKIIIKLNTNMKNILNGVMKFNFGHMDVFSGFCLIFSFV